MGGTLAITGSNVIFNQPTTAATWSFAHNLNTKYPIFQVFNSSDEVVIPEKIIAVDDISALIYFPTPVSGKAVASLGGLSGSINANSASFAATASYVTLAQTASFVTLAQTASFVTLAQTASFVTTAQTASFVANAQSASYWSGSINNSLSASYAATASYVSSNFQYEIHVSQVDGNDTTGNGDLLTPVATITKALTLVAGNRKTIIVHPGTYSESPSITVQYTTITGPGLIGGNIVISGTVSTNTGCTISGIKMTNLTITTPTSTGNVNILNCEISGTLTKSSNADYTVLRLCDYNAASITGAGLIAIFGGNPNFTTVNNASANVILKSVVTVAPVLTAGTLSIVDSIVAAAVTNAFTSAAGTVTTLSNSQFLTSALNNVAPIVLNGFYSIISCIFDKPNSTLVTLSGTGGPLNAIDYFQYIDADNVNTKGLTVTGSINVSGSVVNNLTSSFAVSASQALLAQTASYVTLAQTASFVTLAQTASFVQTAQTASFVTTAQTASFVQNAVSSSFAATASFALNSGGSGVGFPFSGSAVITGSFLVSQSFVDFTQASYVTGSFTGS
jgi:hypothetical protein